MHTVPSFSIQYNCHVHHIVEKSYIERYYTILHVNMLNIPLAIVLVTYSYSNGPVIGQSWVCFILIWANIEIEHGILTQTHDAAREEEYVYHISYEYPKLRNKAF